MAKAIPRRTREVEILDANPIGNRAAWRREAAQLWSLMLSRGRIVRSPGYLFVPNEYAEQTGSKVKVPATRPFTAAELARVVSDRLAADPSVHMGTNERAAVEQWLESAAVVPGERIRWMPQLPAAGLWLRHYGELVVFNRSVTRQRYWAAFLFSALKSDLDYEEVTGRRVTAGGGLDRFLGDGLVIERPLDRDDRIAWSIDRERLADQDPEIHLPVVGLAGHGADTLPSIGEGMPSGWLAGSRQSELQDEFLCPGVIILLRRAIRLLTTDANETSHSVLGELLETALVNHAALYYTRGMRVLNALSDGRQLPADCARCWDRFQGDLVPRGNDERAERWRNEGYDALGSKEDAAWVEANCEDRNEVFVNAAGKERRDAKELARLSLEGLRQQLAAYTVNRIVVRVAWDVAREAAGAGLDAPSSLRDVYARLDEWYSGTETRLMMAALWRAKIAELAADSDVPGVAAEAAGHAVGIGDPAELERIARYVIGETILASRTFSRYVEVLHSLLGGGALPTNQDPKGLVARGGTVTSKFHLALNDRALEAMVAIASLEAGGEPLSFQGFIDFVRRRYGLLVDGHPAGLVASPGLVADASSQSRAGLRTRLSSMGLLEEFSDSSDWNRVHWGPRR